MTNKKLFATVIILLTIIALGNIKTHFPFLQESYVAIQNKLEYITASGMKKEYLIALQKKKIAQEDYDNSLDGLKDYYAQYLCKARDIVQVTELLMQEEANITGHFYGDFRLFNAQYNTKCYVTTTVNLRNKQHKKIGTISRFSVVMADFYSDSNDNFVEIYSFPEIEELGYIHKKFLQKRYKN